MLCLEFSSQTFHFLEFTPLATLCTTLRIVQITAPAGSCCKGRMIPKSESQSFFGVQLGTRVLPKNEHSAGLLVWDFSSLAFRPSFFVKWKPWQYGGWYQWWQK